MELNLNYVHKHSLGYGRLGMELHRALSAKGVTVYDHLPSPPGTNPDPGEGRDAGMASTVCWVSVPTHALGWWATQRTVMFTMWESMQLPESFRENLHNFDRLIVPSDQNVELFSQYHPDVRRVLLGVDPERWHFAERPDPGRYFDFLIGGSGARKGTGLAFEAFKAAFPSERPNGPIPRLVMKNPMGEHFDHERVLVIPGRLSAEDEIDLYASAHCYLQPSRGEGFGLQPLQAIAQGMPTILTDAHGHESFAHLGYGIEAEAKQSDYFMYGDAGDWWEPNLDQLVDTMRWVYANYEKACEKAKVGAAVVAQDFTWASCADQFLDAVGDLTAPFSPGEWVAPTPLKYRVRTTRSMTMDVAGTRHHFQEGRDYWATADLKRILAESGNLDPVCIAEHDSGLTDAQVARLAPVGDHDYCTHCGVRSGTGMTKADDILLEMESASAKAEGDADFTAWHAGA